MMFHDDTTFVENDTCWVCRWKDTNACPRNEEYIGRPLSDPGAYKKPVEICHRFVMTAEEEDRRHRIIMQKLHENLDIDTGD